MFSASFDKSHDLGVKSLYVALRAASGKDKGLGVTGAVVRRMIWVRLMSQIHHCISISVNWTLSVIHQIKFKYHYCMEETVCIDLN